MTASISLRNESEEDDRSSSPSTEGVGEIKYALPCESVGKGGGWPWIEGSACLGVFTRDQR